MVTQRHTPVYLSIWTKLPPTISQLEELSYSEVALPPLTTTTLFIRAVRSSKNPSVTWSAVTIQGIIPTCTASFKSYR